MIEFSTFDQLHSVYGFITAIFFFFIYQIKPKDTPYFKPVVLAGVFIAIVAPFFVNVSPDEVEKLLLRSGKIAHTMTFVLLFYCFLEKYILQEKIPYFFWYCFALGLYSVLDLMITDVFLSAKYQNGKALAVWLQTIGIVNFGFTSPINYLIKFIFLGLFFRDLVKLSKWKKLFQYLVYFLIVFEMVQVCVFKSYLGYDSLSSTVKNIFIIGGIAVLFYHFFRINSQQIGSFTNPYFWITLGLFLPALGEIFLEFIFTKLFETDTTRFYRLHLVRNASQMVGFMMLIVGVWQSKYLKFLPNEY